jgi:large subunit ribosomal protein L10
MKTRETKQRDLAALQDSLQNSKSALLVSFSGLTVGKDQEFRNSIREAGASYQVVKNTLARIAVKGTQFEEATDHFKGVTAIAWTQNDPVILTKAVSKFLKDNADVYNYKTGVVDGKVIDFAQLQTIASLPSKEELISKLLWVLNSSATGIVSVINAVPRNLAVVVKQIGEQKPEEAARPQAQAEESPAAEAAPAEPAPSEAQAPAAEAPAAEESAPAEAAASNEQEPAAEAPAAREEAPADEAAPSGAVLHDDTAAEIVGEPPVASPETSTEAETETVAAAPDDAAEAEVGGAAPETENADGEAVE